MKKRSYLIATILLSAAALSLSSCLKDNRYVDFSKAGNFVDFPKGSNASFGDDAITETPDTDANGTIVRQFAVNVATPNVPTSATTITLAVDNTIVTSYNAAHPDVTYLPMPAGSFVFTTTSITIPAGKQYATTSVTFYKNLLDPSKSYMLPIKIAGTTGGYKISANQGVHYYHFIGNDFAGAYLATFVRVPAGGNYTNAPVTLVPVSPTEFLAPGGYVGARYDVTFTKTGSGATATYNNFTVAIYAPDVTAIFNPAPAITVTAAPVILGYNPAHQYTYTEATTGLFNFQYSVLNGSGLARLNTDLFVKP